MVQGGNEFLTPKGLRCQLWDFFGIFFGQALLSSKFRSFA